MSYKKILAITLLCMNFLIYSYGQEIKWQKTYGGNQADALQSISSTTDKGYILGGRSTSGISGDKTEANIGGADYWVIKTDSTGNMQWQKTVGGTDHDYLVSVIQTSDGGYLLGGHSSSNTSGDKTENCMGGLDFWIVKLDSSGAIEWENTIGGNDFEYFGSIVQAHDGGYLVGGTSNSDISGDKTEQLYGFMDFWIIKLDPLGNIVWQNTIGGNGGEGVYDIVLSSDSGYVVGGRSVSDISVDKTEMCQGGTDYWVVKVDSLGTIQWQNTIGGNQDDLLSVIFRTSDGGYLVGGDSQSGISGDKTEDSYGVKDLWIVKLNDVGDIVWQNTVGGNDDDYCLDIIEITAGEYFVGGTTYSGISGEMTEVIYGLSDYLVIKMDSAGKILWQNTLGGNWNEEFYAFSKSATGELIAAGSSMSNISGDIVANTNGGWDYWFMQLTEEFNAATGTVFADFDSNTLQDISEPPIKYLPIQEQNSGRLSFSNHVGDFQFVCFDTGSYVLNSPLLIHYNSIPQSHTIQFNSFQEIDSLNNFAFQPNGSLNDLCITLTPMGGFRAGFDSYYLLSYNNVGTTAINNISVIFLNDTGITFLSSDLTPSNIYPDSVVWNIGSLNPFESGTIFVKVNVNFGLPIGTIINSGVQIEPILSDVNPSCNTHYFEIITTGSYDPNDIIVNRPELYTTEFPNPPYLDYLIRFQNTGNDTAFFVNVLNPLDTTKLELKTLEVVDVSHPMEMTFIYHERNLKFKFDNILLPDSNINEPQSHGFIRYRIQPKNNLVAGDEIKNFAAIYFDYNQPVLTNQALTQIVVPTSLLDPTPIENNNLIIYPNPTKDKITLEWRNSHHTESISICNVYGQKIIEYPLFTFDNCPSPCTIDISTLPAGVFFVKGFNTDFIKFIKLE